MLGILAGVASAVVGAAGSRSAARSQERAAQRSADVQQQIYDQTRNDLSPFRDMGTNAFRAYAYEMGLGPRPTFGGQPLQVEEVPGVTALPADNAFPSYIMRPGFQAGGTSTPTTFRVGGRTFNTRAEAEQFAAQNGVGASQYGGFTATPGYNFRMREATDAVQASAAARGMLRSGSTLSALSDRAANVATGEYGTYLDRLGGMATVGQNAAAQTGAAGQSYAQGMTNAFAAQGNAASAGAIGTANAIQGGISNGLAMWQYLRPQNR